MNNQKKNKKKKKNTLNYTLKDIKDNQKKKN